MRCPPISDSRMVFRLQERQLESHPVIQSISDILIDSLFDLLVAYERYLKHYPYAEARLRREMTKNEAFRDYVESCSRSPVTVRCSHLPLRALKINGDPDADRVLLCSGNKISARSSSLPSVVSLSSDSSSVVCVRSLQRIMRTTSRSRSCSTRLTRCSDPSVRAVPARPSCPPSD